MTRSVRLSIFVAALLLPAAIASAQGLRVQVLDVGQGDAIMVVAPGGCAMLIDGGPTGSGAEIKRALAAAGVTRLDYAVASHYHADHIGGIDEVDAGTGAVPIAAVYDRGGSYASATYDAYASHFGGRRQPVTLGQTLVLCGQVTFKVVAVNGNGTSSSDENAQSVVLKMSYGAFDALLGGDLTGSSPDIESRVASSIGEVELYKVHHHGSSTSSNATLLATILPTVAVLSLGANNTYGHPSPETIARLDAVGADRWQTEDPTTGAALGDVVIASADGSSFTVSQGGVTVSYPSKGGSPPPADTTPPSAPGGLAGVAASSTRIDLSWQAATDDVGVTGYRVYRSGNDGVYTLAGTANGTTFSDVGLAPATPYWHIVTALDAAGNESDPSAAVATTTPAAPPCTVDVTSLRWSQPKQELLVRATCSEQPGATLSASAGGTPLGTLTWSAKASVYELRTRLPARPSCIDVAASCGGTAQRCF